MFGSVHWIWSDPERDLEHAAADEPSMKMARPAMTAGIATTANTAEQSPPIYKVLHRLVRDLGINDLSVDLCICDPQEFWGQYVAISPLS
jgi:hypothetical protein